jgi:hypothetical protein
MNETDAGHEPKAKSSFWRGPKFNKVIALSVGFIVFVAGLAYVATSALGFFVVVEPENATVASNASVVSDVTATGGKAIQFNAPPQTPPPPPPPPPTTPGACPNAKHTPGGPDGMNGCWPYEGNTGVPAGTALSNYSGSCTITAANTVIDKKTVNCNLSIRAKNVMITNSKINGAIIVDDTLCGSASFAVSDSTIFVADINLRGLMSCSYTATRVNVSGGQSMAWCDNCTIQDSYLHHPLEDPAGAAANHAAHNSTVRISKFATLKHNTLWCFVKEYSQPNGQDTSGCSANQTGYSHDGAPPYNSRIEANLYMPTSGGYCAYGGSTTGATSSVHDIVFINNVFKRTAFNGQGGPNCGFWGAVTSFDSNRPGNQWVNNKWDDGTVLPPSN